MSFLTIRKDNNDSLQVIMQEPQNLPSIGGYSSKDKRQSESGEDIVLNNNIQLTDRGT